MPTARFQKAKRIKLFPVGDDFHQNQKHFSIFKDSTENEIRPAEGGGFLRANIQKGNIFYRQAAEKGENGLFAMGKNDFGGDVVVHKKNLGHRAGGGKS